MSTSLFPNRKSYKWAKGSVSNRLLLTDHTHVSSETMYHGNPFKQYRYPGRNPNFWSTYLSVCKAPRCALSPTMARGLACVTTRSKDSPSQRPSSSMYWMLALICTWRVDDMHLLGISVISSKIINKKLLTLASWEKVLLEIIITTWVALVFSSI